jgi:hypothetical protein
MTNLIQMNKQYKTKSGLPVRVLCVDCENKYYPVVAIVDGDVFTYTKEGYFDGEAYPDDYDLVEVSPYDDFKKGDYVMVRDCDGDRWYPRVFAGVSEGAAVVYPCEYNPWSNNDMDTIRWSYCRKPTKEELAKAGITE